MTTVLGILIAILAAGLVVWQRSSRRDETFAGITPGLVPASAHAPLRQRMALVKGAGEEARAFYRYLQGPAARAVFSRFGFTLPAP